METSHKIIEKVGLTISKSAMDLKRAINKRDVSIKALETCNEKETFPNGSSIKINEIQYPKTVSAELKTAHATNEIDLIANFRKQLIDGRIRLLQLDRDSLKQELDTYFDIDHIKQLIYKSLPILSSVNEANGRIVNQLIFEINLRWSKVLQQDEEEAKKIAEGVAMNVQQQPVTIETLQQELRSMKEQLAKLANSSDQRPVHQRRSEHGKDGSAKQKKSNQDNRGRSRSTSNQSRRNTDTGKVGQGSKNQNQQKKRSNSNKKRES
jgi:hypothetical protein